MLFRSVLLDIHLEQKPRGHVGYFTERQDRGRAPWVVRSTPSLVRLRIWALDSEWTWWVLERLHPVCQLVPAIREGLDALEADLLEQYPDRMATPPAARSAPAADEDEPPKWRLDAVRAYWDARFKDGLTRDTARGRVKHPEGGKPALGTMKHWEDSVKEWLHVPPGRRSSYQAWRVLNARESASAG